MLSGEFSYVEVSSILVHESERIRKETSPEGIQELGESIRKRGLMHPPIITRENVLVAGYRRLMACRAIGMVQVPVQFADTLEPDELLAIELEENVKRQDLSWQDQCLSLLRLHELKISREPVWNDSKTAEAIGYSVAHVNRQLMVARELRAGNTRVVDAPKYSTASNIVVRERERAAQDSLASIREVEDAPPPATPFLHEDFNEWGRRYSGPTFNLLHCDFPYGIGHDSFNQGSGAELGTYSDTEEEYWELIDTLCSCKESLLGDSAHILFWFSMRHYTKTLDTLQKHFRVDPYPVVWHKSDNKGTLPDPQRGPRRVYEVAFLCSHGDRKIIQAVSNVFSGPTERLVGHASEKSVSMLSHFFKMFIDPNTRMLDPTSGSGSAVRAAIDMGAPHCIGLEKNSQFYADAVRAWGSKNV